MVQVTLVGATKLLFEVAAQVAAKFGGVVARATLHKAFVPPFEPLHDHNQGPVPVTAVVVPTEQRLAVGAKVSGVEVAEPQAPFTKAAFGSTTVTTQLGL